MLNYEYHIRLGSVFFFSLKMPFYYFPILFCLFLPLFLIRIRIRMFFWRTSY